MTSQTAFDVQTPCLMLHRKALARNCERMSARVTELGVSLRPHMKTAKCVEAARIALKDRPLKVTVSTVAEARLFASAGIGDILYAVSATPQRVAQLAPLVEAGATITLIGDKLETIEMVSTAASKAGVTFRFLIEIDSGEHRAGLLPDDPQLVEIARAVDRSPSLKLDGVMTHAGHSYWTDDRSQIERTAEDERRAVVDAAETIRAAGMAAPVVSLGSTPTVLSATSLDGVTEVRPGVYTLMDLDQHLRGLCERDDIAAYVLSTVIGHSNDGRAIIDAGALALSKDISAGRRADRFGYGLVEPVGTDHSGPPLYVAAVFQEHGMVATAHDNEARQYLPVGSLVRVLPNHACITAAAYDRFLVPEDSGAIQIWERTVGWH